MLFEFKTARNANGHQYYLAIDTELKTYTTECPHMITDGVEIKTRDYKEFLRKCEKAGYFKA